MIKKTRQLMEAALVFALALTIACLPRKISLLLAEKLALIAYRHLRKIRERALSNLEQAIAAGGLSISSSPGALIENSMRVQGRSFFEIVKIHCGLGGAISKSVEVRGMENYRAARSQNRGVLFISGHCGNWELLARVLGMELGGLSFVVKRQSNSMVNTLLEKTRVASGNRLIYKGGAVKQITDELGNDGRVMILIDQDVFLNEGYMLDFLGREACTTKMPALLATRTEAAVLPVFIHAENHKNIVEILPEAKMAQQADEEAATRENSQRFIDYIADYVRAYPEQWLWIQPRWRAPRGNFKTRVMRREVLQAAPESAEAGQK